MAAMRSKSMSPVLTFVGQSRSGRLWGFSQYTWLRYVSGFDSSEHCAKSLLGFHSKRVWYEAPLNVPITLDEARDYDYLYLCGVSANFEWNKNLHMPVRPAPGESALGVTWNGIRCVIRNAQLVDIPELEKGWGGYSSEFTTCRNWRFGIARYGLTQPKLL
jgi:hypothetical protein